MIIYCCGCEKDVEARLTNGAEVYSHRRDLYHLPFWKCDVCENTVGCHHKTKNRTQPLGCIPTKELKNARQHIHRILDPLWQSGDYTRRGIYKLIAERLGIEKRYHTASIKTLEEAREVFAVIKQIQQEGKTNE